MTASSFIQKGIDAASKARLTEAEQCFRQAFSLSQKGSPEERNSLANLIKALAEQGKGSELIDLFKESADDLIFKLPPMPLLVGAELASKYQQTDLSLKLYNLLNSQYPCQKEVILGMSSTMTRAGQLKEAEALLIRYQQQVGLSAEVATNLAILALEQGKLAQAECGYRQALELENNRFITNYNLAKFLQTHKDLEEALKYYNQCLLIVPTAFEALIEKADVLHKLNKNSEAAAIYQSLIQSNKLKTSQKNYATRQYLYTLLEAESHSPANEEISDLLAGLVLDNETLSLIYDLPETHQRTHGGRSLYQPGTLIQEIQYLSTNDTILDNIAKEITENASLIHDRANKPTRGGQQTHELLLDPSRTIGQVYEKIKAILIDYGTQLPTAIRIDPNKKYGLSGWAVSLQSGGYQLRHTHPEAVVSAVLYITIPEEIEQASDESGCLYFSKRRADQQNHAIKIKPAPGKLVMFPSFLPHETTPFEAISERICIACNLIRLD